MPSKSSYRAVHPDLSSPVQKRLPGTWQRPQSPTIQKNFFTTVAMAQSLFFPALAFATQNVFNNKADFKILLDFSRQDRPSAKGLFAGFTPPKETPRR